VFPVPFLMFGPLSVLALLLNAFFYLSFPKESRQSPTFKLMYSHTRASVNVISFYILFSVLFVLAFVYFEGIFQLIVLIFFNVCTFIWRYFSVYLSEKHGFQNFGNSQVFQITLMCAFATTVSLPANKHWYIYLLLFFSKVVTFGWPLLMAFYHKTHTGVSPQGSVQFSNRIFNFSSIQKEVSNCFQAVFVPVVSTVLYVPVIAFYCFSYNSPQTLYYYAGYTQVLTVLATMIVSAVVAVILFIIARNVFINKVNADPLALGVEELSKFFWLYFACSLNCMYFITGINILFIGV